jgi:hypothetical protein
MMFDHLDNEGLLAALDAERRRFTESDKARMKTMIDELIERCVYPKETVQGNPSSVYTMVDGWGARWHEWRGPFECPHCKADLRDHRTGPPFKREIGHVDERLDRCTGFSCPDCKKFI